VAYAQSLTERLDRRLRQPNEERDIHALPPLVRGAALVVPLGLLRHAGVAVPEGFADKEVERLAMEPVMAAERALGREPREAPRRLRELATDSVK
jgi:hypothetical protein